MSFGAVHACATLPPTPWLGTLWDGIGRLRGKPVQIVWGLKDIAFRAQELRRQETLAMPQTPNPSPASFAAAISALTAEVLAVEQRWTAAHLQGDFATLADLMADDYVRIAPGGSVSGRAAVLAAYQPEHRHWDHAAGDEYDVRIYGDLTGDPTNDPGAVLTALVTGRWTARGTDHGERFDYTARFLSIYVRRGGRWQMVAEQSTPIA